MSLTKFVGLLAGSTLTLSSVSYGATEATNDTAAQLTELKAEIAALKAQQGEQWLTEQRASQVRGIVQDVLADADTRASLQNTAATSGYDKGFFISSADGNFKLKITALEQIRFVWNNSSEHIPNVGPNNTKNTWGFEDRRTQVWFTGNVVDPSWTYALGISYASQNDPYYQAPTNTFGLGYAYVRKTWQNTNDRFWIQAGQFSAPWTLESNLWSAGQAQMGEFSQFEYLFGVGVVQGILAGWENEWLRVQASFSNNFTPLTSPPPGGQSWNSGGNQSIAFAGRADIKLAGNWAQFNDESSFRGEEFGAKIGGAFMYANGRQQNLIFVPGEATPLGVTVDGQLDFGGANLIVQFAYQDDANFGTGSTTGWNIQGGFFLADGFELFGAWTIGHANVYPPPAAAINGSVASVGANWYMAKDNIKMTVAILIPIDANGAPAPAGFGVPTPPGTGLSANGNNNFAVMAQLQMTF